MFGILNYKVFLLSGILLNITPGADTIYILTRSVSQGRRSGIISVLGIGTGCLVHTIMAGLGLSIILAKSALAFNIIKYIGAAYLVYLGIKSFLSKTSLTDIDNKANQKSFKKIYFEALLTNTLNPKVALFFLAFMPQFINPANTFGSVPFFILGSTFAFTGVTWCLLLVLFSSIATKKLREHNNISLFLNKITGLVFVALGIKLLKTKVSN